MYMLENLVLMHATWLSMLEREGIEISSCKVEHVATSIEKVHETAYFDIGEHEPPPAISAIISSWDSMPAKSKERSSVRT